MQHARWGGKVVIFIQERDRPEQKTVKFINRAWCLTGRIWSFRKQFSKMENMEERNIPAKQADKISVHVSRRSPHTTLMSSLMWLNFEITPGIKLCTSVPLKSLSVLPSGIKWVLRVTVRIVIREIKTGKASGHLPKKIKKYFRRQKKRHTKKLL